MSLPGIDAAVPTPVQPAMPGELAAGLPADGAPWRLDLDGWSATDAQRWRALLVQGADARRCLLADRGADLLLLQRLEAGLGAPVGWLQQPAEALDQALKQVAEGFRALRLVSDGDAAEPAPNDGHELGGATLDESAHPVVRLLDATLHDALQEGASDIHLECDARGAEIRYRIDGVLVPVHRVDGVARTEQLVSRLKVMAELDIGESRLPQDGRFKLRLPAREVDFRLSILPGVYGEDAVLRVLDRSQIESARGSLSLSTLGLAEAIQHEVRALAVAPHGLLLVAGPTGSGKTTTLYAALTDTRRAGEKTITIEDPVEYLLAGAVQIPVNERKGLGFARGLRSVLRHDPDRIMVGEIRDPETAEIAVQAALTGHVVYSTVHANGAFDVIGRFTHMGLDPYHVVSALNGVLAQRLIRELCPRCAQPQPLDDAHRAALGPRAPAARLRRAVGCASCRGTGYRGRRAVAEMLRLDDPLRDLIVSRAPLAALKDAARRKGLRPLREAALDLVADGSSTLQEADRVTLDA